MPMIPPHPPYYRDLDWIKFEIPLDMNALSKNRQRTVVRTWNDGKVSGGRIKTTEAYQRALDAIAWEARSAMLESGIVFHPERKVWVGLMVRKSRKRRIDAVNVVDAVSDGIAAGIGVDDSQFSLFCLDWEYAGKEPTLMIWVGQERTVEPTVEDV